MSAHWMRRLLLTSALPALVTGCGWAGPTQVARYRAANQQLAQQVRAQRAELENIRSHSHRIEDQLIQAEEELALLDEKHGIGGGQQTAPQAHHDPLQRDLAGTGSSASAVPPPIRRQLGDLARRYPHLRYDPRIGIARLDTDILFDSGEDELKPGARRVLDDLAATLSSPAGRDLKVMVVGHTDDQQIRGRETRHRFASNWHLSSARALAVADRLLGAGVGGQRLGLAGFGKHQPVATNVAPESRQQNRRVEIFLMSPDVPVVGMTETLTSLY